MNTFCQTINSETLAAVLALPATLRHRRVQITIQPVGETVAPPPAEKKLSERLAGCWAGERGEQAQRELTEMRAGWERRIF